ncbi:MAG: GNAT family N-acetyltransferase [Acidihalobacter sp.]|jgi:RimJ/RimL family protein N-acetyltransferase
MELETPRLFLRQWRDDDLPPFAALNADPRVMEYFPAPLSRAESDAMAERCRALIEEHGWGLWAVETKRESTFIGFVGLNSPAYELPFSPCVEIGWRLAFEHWGKGYASEAARAALRVGFDGLRLAEIVSFTALDNLRSQAVMRRIGMHKTPIGFDHPRIAEGNPLRRHCLYRLTRTKWLTDNS